MIGPFWNAVDANYGNYGIIKGQSIETRNAEMSETLHKSEDRFSYVDYLKWPEGERWELIDGVAYDMTPAPSRRHQDISGRLYFQFFDFLRDKNCVVYSAPLEVRLPEANEPDERILTVVQPDLLVVCDQSKLDERGCRGAPDFIAEILSPSTSAKDQIQKLALYECHGVREYWIIHPLDHLVMVRVLDENGKYGIPLIREGKGSLEVATLPGLNIDLDAMFAQ